MFDFDTVIELMKKYGYSSTSVHPYIYQNGDNLGICYTYIDDEYGLLERIKIFENIESFEDFLKQLEFVKNHGKENNIRMVLDNYESMNPKVLFLRNEMIMLEGEMFNIEDFDRSQKQRTLLDPVTQVIYKAGDLLLVYDEIKGRQLQYLKNIVTLKNTLRKKYFELQKEIDIYNKYKVERELNLLPDVNDIGINDRMEIAIKDRYNIYVAQPPSYEEAVDFLREVWDLNKNLELNKKYYEAQKDENDTRNEIKVVDAKLELMKKLNEDYRPLFGIDLVSRFRKINKKYNLVNNKMSNDMVTKCIENVERKYSVYDYLDILSTSDYLREAMQNTNYGDLAIKYSNATSRDMVITNRLPLNEAAASLSLQYRDKLTVQEQAIMVLYNNHKYRKLCNAILEVENFDTLPVKKVINKISGIKGFSKIKSECYDIVKKRINDPINETIKTSLFAGFDFSTFENFVSCLIQELVKLRHVNKKMIINGNINMYLQIKKVEDVTDRKFIMVTNDLNSLLNETKENNNMIGIVFLKKETPVLYSPYYFDVGDIYTKGASLQMYIREMINFELLIEINDIAINIDPVKTDVVRYYTNPEVYNNISVVEDIMMSYKTTFCKYSFRNNLPVVQQEVSVNPIAPTNVENSEVNTEVASSNEINNIPAEVSPVIVQSDTSVQQNEVNLENVGASVQAAIEGTVVNSINSNKSAQVSTSVEEKALEDVNRKEQVESNITVQEKSLSNPDELDAHNTIVESRNQNDSSKVVSDSKGSNPVKKIEVNKQSQPVQTMNKNVTKVEDGQTSKNTILTGNKVNMVLQNNVIAKPAVPNTVTTKKVVQQVVSKPVVSSSSNQAVVKKVVTSASTQKVSSSVVENKGQTVAVPQSQVKQATSNSVKAGVPVQTSKPAVAGIVKPITNIASVPNNKQAVPLNPSTRSVVQKPNTNVQTVNKSSAVGVNNNSVNSFAQKVVSPNVSEPTKVAVQKKVVVNSVAGQNSTKSSVVVSKVGSPTHIDQSVQNKNAKPSQTINTTNMGVLKNNADVEKKKVESAK